MQESVIHPILQVSDPKGPLINLFWVLLHHYLGLGLPGPKPSLRKWLQHHPLLVLLLWLHHYQLLLHLLWLGIRRGCGCGNCIYCGWESVVGLDY